jgi:hypothetical protein
MEMSPRAFFGFSARNVDYGVSHAGDEIREKRARWWKN